MAGAVPHDRVAGRVRLPKAAQVRAGLVCATAALLAPGYVLAAAVPLFVVWVLENASARRWPWEPSPVDWALFLWVAAVALSSALSPHRELAVPNAVLLALGPVVGMAPVLRSLRERPTLLLLLCAFWVAGAVVAGGWVVWRYLHAGPGGRGDLPQLGWNAAGTVLAAASLLAAGLASHKSWGRAAWLAQVPVLAGLLATLSRGAWMGWLVGVVCLTVLVGPHGRRLHLGLAGLVLTVVAATVTYPAAWARFLSSLDPQRNLDRLLLWRAALRMVADHPWTGVGFGAFVREYPSYRLEGDPNTAPPFAHNLPLSLAAETGLVGLAAFLVFLAAVIRAGLRAVLRAPPAGRPARAAVLSALAAVLAQQLVDGTLQSFHLGFAFWFLSAALVAAADTPGSEAAG